MTRSALVALSEVKDGTMYIPSDQENREVVAHRKAWLEKHQLSITDATRLYISYDTDDFCRYRIVDASHKNEAMEDGNAPRADVLVTTNVGQVLFLPVADCVATTIFDKEHGVLMLSHLGRHSLEQQGGTRSVEFLVEKFGSDPRHLEVWVGPAPNKEAYPIFKLGNKGMKEAALEQLQAAGVQLERIHNNDADTVTDDRYFSYSEFIKGKQPEGRFAMLAVMLDDAPRSEAS